MSSKLKIGNCRIKPYQLLRDISDKFGFELGIPEHIFSRDEQAIKIKLKFGCLEFNAEAYLRTGRYSGQDCYVVGYKGAVLNQKKEVDYVDYSAYILNSAGGCFSCGGMRSGMQIIQDEKTPDWFPIED